MTILIVEDEPRTAIDLANTIREVEPEAEIVQMTDSIEATVSYLEKSPQPDLAFFDIQLADGLSFEIFQQTEILCPVIFCTAFDEYALQAFQTNGIAYLLKPFDEKSVAQALEKINSIATFYQGGQQDMSWLAKEMSQVQETRKSAFLVSFQGKYIPISVQKVAFFTLLGESTWLYDFKGESYHLPYSLEELEGMLDSHQFYRVNRQYIINYEAVLQVTNDFARKLIVKLCLRSPDTITVSKAKAPMFLKWLEER